MPARFPLNVPIPKVAMIMAALLVLLPGTAWAQIGLPSQPQLPVPSPRLPQAPAVEPDLPVTDALLEERLEGLSAKARRSAIRLLKAKDQAARQLLRRHGGLIERDAAGDLARRGELLALDANESELAALTAQGFQIIGTENIDGLDMGVTRMAVPNKMSLKAAQLLANSLAPQAEVVADNLHFQSASAPVPSILMQASSRSIGLEVGMIDGGTAKAVPIRAVKGFAKGAPLASNHGTAVATLLRSAGVRRIRVADVYGSDPAGGNALAVAKGIGWLVQNGSKVISISLVGPRNALVQRAIASAQRKGAVIVAAVGNDGPAARPAYPASYKGVVAVTGVDKKGRALIEAGRALNLDYAAPGANIYAVNAKGKRVKLRGTSFATPLVAARLAAARQRTRNWRLVLDREARDLGVKGPDKTFGRGLICGACARKR